MKVFSKKLWVTFELTSKQNFLNLIAYSLRTPQRENMWPCHGKSTAAGNGSSWPQVLQWVLVTAFLLSSAAITYMTLAPTRDNVPVARSIRLRCV